jgi:hypothetical protein
VLERARAQVTLAAENRAKQQKNTIYLNFAVLLLHPTDDKTTWMTRHSQQKPIIVFIYIIVMNILFSHEQSVSIVDTFREQCRSTTSQHRATRFDRETNHILTNQYNHQCIAFVAKLHLPIALWIERLSEAMPTTIGGVRLNEKRKAKAMCNKSHTGAPNNVLCLKTEAGWGVMGGRRGGGGEIGAGARGGELLVTRVGLELRIAIALVARRIGGDRV